MRRSAAASRSSSSRARTARSGGRSAAADRDVLRARVRAVAFDEELPAGRSRDEQLALAARYRDATLAGDAVAGGRDRRGGRGRRAWTRWRCSPPRSRRSGRSGRRRRPAAPTVDGRCSDLVAAPPATADGHVWVAHTNDLSPASEASVDRDRVAGAGRAGGVLAGHRAVDQRRLERGRAVADRQRAVAQRRAGRRPAAADGPRAAHRADARRGGGDGPAARPRVLVQHGVRAPRRARRERGGLRDGRRGHGPVGRRDAGPHQPLRLRPDAAATRATRRTRAAPRCGSRRALELLDGPAGAGPRAGLDRAGAAARRARGPRDQRPRSAATTTARRPRSPRSGAWPTSRPARSATAAARAAAGEEARYRFA